MYIHFIYVVNAISIRTSYCARQKRSRYPHKVLSTRAALERIKSVCIITIIFRDKFYGQYWQTFRCGLYKWVITKVAVLFHCANV